MAFITFTSTDSNNSTPDTSTYGSHLNTDELQDAMWLVFKEATSMDPNFQIVDVDFSQIASNNSSCNNFL